MEKVEPKQDQVATTPDGFGLGVSKGQRSAEVLAAGRADMMPSPETKTLSRWSARIFNKLFLSLIKKSSIQPLMNYGLVRHEGMRILCDEALKGRDNPVMVDIASGFSPRALFLAREAPHIRVIDLDQEAVITEKQRRLRNGRIEIPENLEFISADLGRIPLSQVLDGLLVDVISAEGLNAYFVPEEVTQIAKGVYQSLKPDGVYVSSITLREGINEIMSALSFFSRQAGQILSIMETPEDAIQLFLDAGYDQINLYLPTDLAETYDLARPVFNIETIVVAKKIADTAEDEAVAASITEDDTVVDPQNIAKASSVGTMEDVKTVTFKSEVSTEEKTSTESKSNTEQDAPSESTDS